MSDVQLYVYDLSKGLARSFGPMLGLSIEGVWHSAIVVHGKEIYFGQGIHVCDAGKTHLGAAEKVEQLGKTELPWEIIAEYLEDINERWSAEKYHLLEHNCNHFSAYLSEFLTGAGIPLYVSSVASQVAATPFGQMLSQQLAFNNGGATWVP
ncbi:hypothetical protein DASB73_041360 [Starmerella bacillaris]|uniref:PPPDE domain-containing protein n=1 Tax=Starmerella bacillaris TaxID=1247836 RepID=A0AAV5RR53_STABA|nr:hypothetical protein DASB73_041360 [Starmerella bacillaris]